MERPHEASLLELMDLLVVHRDVEAMLPDLAVCLRQVVDFDEIALVLPRGGAAADLYTLPLLSAETRPTATEVEVATLPPLQDTKLAELWAGEHPVVLHALDDVCDYAELLAGLREAGKQSACLLPLTTAVRPVGVMVLASSNLGAYDQSDAAFLGRVGNYVAIAIDDVRRSEEALAHQRRVEAERDHWRTLLEINNAVVTNLDLKSLRAAIEPSLRRLVPHDSTSLMLLRDQGERLGPLAFDPEFPPWVEEMASALILTTAGRPDQAPIHVALALRKPIDIDMATSPALEPFVKRGGEHLPSKRLCYVPLATARRRLGALMLGRHLPEPFTEDEMGRAMQAADQIAIAVENALAFGEIEHLKDQLAQQNVYLTDEIQGTLHFGEIVGDSKALQRVLAQLRSVAPTDTSVLLLGETGTGKELIARAIHSMSERKARTLVTVNCATSPTGLLESEWFGHEKGAFTGALNQKPGRFELANQGTLFLDEIGDVPLDLQSKLLRALQEHEIERLGSTRTIHVDFRLIAATNRNLQEMVAKREYRSDLYYRLNVFPIKIPPLRDRREDIPPLVRYFTQRYAKRLRRPIESVARESMDALCRWHWPGNVRELQNVIERAVILSPGATLRVSLSEFEASAEPPPGLAVSLEDAERQHILRTLEETGWVIGGPAGAASRLGLKRTTLFSTMRRLGISRPRPERSGGGGS
ncbi:MAG TPA: sigma 54-interacting transcriptional regulator [Vicinamibacterales bacterium]|jgi:formate hydrogenlyase transcriptional activator